MGNLARSVSISEIVHRFGPSFSIAGGHIYGHRVTLHLYSVCVSSFAAAAIAPFGMASSARPAWAERGELWRIACALLVSLPLLVSVSAEPLITSVLKEGAYPDAFSTQCEPEEISSKGAPFDVDVHRLQRQIDELALLSETPHPSVTRVLYTDQDVAARSYVKELMLSVGLSVREDAIGNIFGRWHGTEVNLKPVATGSHIDAIPYAGKYDGVVGVLGGIEAIRTLKRAGFQPKRSVEVIMFTSEEPTRFGLGCIGSRALAGSEGILEILKGAVDAQNISFADAARHAGYLKTDADLESVTLSNSHYQAFIELHIEQGPILEQEGRSIGIVTAIAAPATLKVSFRGGGGHAGAVLMPLRNDAGLAAAELMLAVEKHVLASGSIDTVGTTGVLEIHPGAVNSIPREAHLIIDVRDIDLERRDKVVEKILSSAQHIASQRHVELSNFEIVNQDPPAVSSDKVIQAALMGVEQLGLTHKLMISRAYHDALFMARIAPMGMIFIPCHKGYSHRPDEYASKEDIGKGVQVLSFVLARLSVVD